MFKRLLIKHDCAERVLRSRLYQIMSFHIYSCCVKRRQSFLHAALHVLKDKCMHFFSAHFNIYISYLISGISKGGHNRKNNLWNILPRVDCYIHWKPACWHSYVPIGNCLASFMPSRNPNDYWQYWQWAGCYTYYHQIWRSTWLFLLNFIARGTHGFIQRIWGIGAAVWTSHGYREANKDDFWETVEGGRTSARHGVHTSTRPTK